MNNLIKTLLISFTFLLINIPFSTNAALIGECKDEKCVDYFNKWKVMAKANRAVAMSKLAELYYAGYGTNKSLEQSIKYFRKASIYQIPYAQYRAGLFYLKEDGYIDYKEGIRYLKKAARNGHSESAFLLGIIYNSDDLVPKSVEDSDKWLEKALKGQHVAAQNYVNYLYKSKKVSDDNYSRVNKYINKFKVDLADTKQETVVSNDNVNSSDIQWPKDSEVEVIAVTSPSLEDIFDYELDALKTAPPSTNIATGTKIRGRRCEQIFSCYGVDKEDFERFINNRSGNL